jgi:hypothetical protein
MVQMLLAKMIRQTQAPRIFRDLTDGIHISSPEGNYSVSGIKGNKGLPRDQIAAEPSKC